MNELNQNRIKYSKPTKNSEKIILETKHKKINEIFEKLDSDKDG